MNCGKCIYFKVLLSNSNFGKCVFPEDYRTSNGIDMDAIMSGLGYSTNTPIVHKENEYSCFEGVE